MLKGYTVPLSPRGIANLATKPPWHYAGSIVAVEPAVHELVMAIYDDQTITGGWAGSGDLDFPEAPGEELHDLAPVRTGAGFQFTLSYSVTDLRTLQ